MRAALMTMTCAAVALIPEKAQLQGNIVVAGVVCEETFEGIAFGKILDRLEPDLVILGEATELNLCIGQRGRAEIRIITQGKSAHSANPAQGVNAVTQMMRLCQRLEHLNLPVDALLGPAILELTDIHSEPYPGKSVVPERCLATFDRRTLPGESAASVLQPLQEIIAQLHDENSIFQAKARIVAAQERCYTGQTLSGTRFFPAWKAATDALYVRNALRALEKTGLPAQCSHYSFCTDGSQSAGVRGIPTIGFGPSRETLAHVADEYIELEQIERAYQGYIALLRGLLLA
jgi:acetylornithine deacetylase/succinyl-diaminopimelate desuccinylase-like protein